MRFHPTANNVLASISTDTTVKLWDIEKGEEMSSLDDAHDNLIQVTCVCVYLQVKRRQCVNIVTFFVSVYRILYGTTVGLAMQQPARTRVFAYVMHDQQ